MKWRIAQLMAVLAVTGLTVWTLPVVPAPQPVLEAEVSPCGCADMGHSMEMDEGQHCGCGCADAPDEAPLPVEMPISAVLASNERAPVPILPASPPTPTIVAAPTLTPLAVVAVASPPQRLAIPPPGPRPFLALQVFLC